MSEINKLCEEVYQNAKLHGFNEIPVDIPRRLALIHSEVSEALEADRIGEFSVPVAFKQAVLNVEHTDKYWQQEFEAYIKDTFEDELADIVIRVFDTCARLEIDLDFHIKSKMKYNSTRPVKHGNKKY